MEAYAPGTPIFALSGNDTLTGASANNEFVFAQPIGNDTIYDFNVATDKIDLTGFAKIASFSDIQANIADDGHGDAVITIGAGETITLQSISVASLTASDFVFNQTPVVNNAGAMVVSDGAVLPLSGTISNTGTIALELMGDQTELQITGEGITLQGGGKVALSGDAVIAGTNSSSVLDNVDNTIFGAGHIGAGDGNLSLVNEARGTIDANVLGTTLTVDTGNAVVNQGVLEASNGGTLLVADGVNNSGILEANGGTLHFEASVSNSGAGSAVVAAGTLEFDAASNVNVTFNNGSASTSYGELVLKDASQFTGEIAGFAGTAPDQAHSDTIDLAGINYSSASFSESYDPSTGLLTVTDGSNSAKLVSRTSTPPSILPPTGTAARSSSIRHQPTMRRRLSPSAAPAMTRSSSIRVKARRRSLTSIRKATRSSLTTSPAFRMCRNWRQRSRRTRMAMR